MFGVQQALARLCRMRHRHHHRAVDEFGERRQHRVGDDRAPILADQMHRFAAPQCADQLGDIGGKCGFVIKTVARNLARRIATQIRRDRTVTRLSQRRHLMAPGLGGVGETMQQQDERATAFFEIGEVKTVGVDVIHGSFRSI